MAAARMPLAGARYSVQYSKDAHDLGAPLRNRTVDLLLTITTISQPRDRRTEPDQAKDWLTLAPASAGQPSLAAFCPQNAPRDDLQLKAGAQKSNSRAQIRFCSPGRHAKSRPHSPSESPIFDIADLTEIARDQMRQQFREHGGPWAPSGMPSSRTATVTERIRLRRAFSLPNIGSAKIQNVRAAARTDPPFGGDVGDVFRWKCRTRESKSGSRDQGGLPQCHGL